MTELKSQYDDFHDNRFPCDCSDWHHLRVWYYDKDPNEPLLGSLEIADAFVPNSFKEKMQATWKIFRNKPHYHSGVILDATNIKDLIATLQKVEKEADKN